MSNDEEEFDYYDCQDQSVDNNEDGRFESNEEYSLSAEPDEDVSSNSWKPILGKLDSFHLAEKGIILYINYVLF